MFRNLVLFVMLAVFFSLAGCAVAPKPLVGLVPEKEAETLQSPISISIRTPDGSRGGRGYLIFKRPDRFHIAILSPFGLTLMEVFSDGDRLTCLIPSKNIAYSGRIADLPAREGLRTWGLMRWVVEKPPVPGPALKRDHVTADGRRETVYYDNQGVVLRKETEEGDRVSFSDYQVYDGVAFPSVLEISAVSGESVRITFDEPELNKPVEEGALVPNLDGVTVLPFSAFNGF